MASFILRAELQMRAAAGFASLWIVIAIFYRHSGDADPQPVRWALSALGLWFLACGVWTYLRTKTPASGLFLWYCAFSGVHWGGPIGAGSPYLQSAELAFYIVAGALLPQAVFLDLARRLKSADGARSPNFLWAPYAPVAAGFVFFLAVLAFGEADVMIEAFGAFYAIGVLLSLIGGAIFIARPFIQRKNRFANGAIALAIIVGWTPHAVVASGLISANGLDGLFNLPLALIPLALAWRIGGRVAHDASPKAVR